MKHAISMLAVCTALASAASAQQTTGTVRYEETISFGTPTLEGDAAQFAALLPKEQKLGHVLYFNPDATMFQPVVNEKQEPEAATPAEGIHIRMDIPQERYYTNLREGQSVSARELFGRKFLVTGSPAKHSWKMTGQQKTILSYACQEAVLYREHDTVRAWFTTAIPVSAGPRGLSGLPGLILAVQEGSRSSMVATAVTPEVPAEAIVAPKGGKKVTDEEFKAIVEAKMKEMGATRGPGGEQVIIKVRHN